MLAVMNLALHYTGLCKVETLETITLLIEKGADFEAVD